MAKKKEKVKTTHTRRAKRGGWGQINQTKYQFFFWEALLFSLTLISGIGAAFRINQILKPAEISLPQISIWQFIFYFLIGTTVILLISVTVKIKRQKSIVFKALFVLVTAWGSLIFLSLWLPGFSPLILIGLLIWWWLRKPSVIAHNLCVILGMAGVGSVLGLRFNPLVIVGLLVIFSIYDWIAVYKTKHMVKIAKSMIESRAVLGLIVPQKVSGFLVNLKKVKPGKRFLFLGGGDVAFSLIFSVSLISEGIIKSLIVALFALLGLFFCFWIFASQRVRRPIPALPPIALFLIIGYLITRIID